MNRHAVRAAELLGTEARGAAPLQGGDLSSVLRLTTADGRTAVVKVAPTARAEGDMLEAIRARGVPAPEVLAATQDLLVLSDLGRDDGPAGAWGDLGRVLRRLHDADTATDTAYGWPVDHAFGPVEIPNGRSDDWPAFWAERRLLPACPHLPADLAKRVEALAARLPDLLPRRPAPALLHGDLWSGNVMARDGRVSGLIDPACYHGDAEVDLAMLTLFGAPGPAFHDAYGPLAPGAGERRPIYQLWPALCHLRLFGGAYRGLVARCLDSAGAG